MPLSPVMASCQECVAARSTNARGGVPVGEADSLGSELIEVRGWDLGFRVVGGQITETEIVGIED